jgi:hypothetical protein
MFRCGEQASPIFEGVMEIRVDIQSCKGKNLITRHTWATKAPRVTTVHNDFRRVELDPPYTSAHLPRDTSTGIHSWPPHYPFYHLLSMVGYRPTQRPSRLLNLWDPKILYALVHNQSLFIQTQSTRALTDTGGAYNLGALNFRSDHSPFLPIDYSRLSPNCPTWSPIIPTIWSCC